MNQILRLKYPVYNSKKEIWLSAVSIALLAYLFLVIFQPFGTYNYTHANKYLLLVPYAAISFVIFLSGDFAVSRYFTKWTWSREILKTSVLLSVCSLLNYWYNISFINHTDFSLRALIYMGIFTFALGIPVCAIYILGRYSFLKPLVHGTTPETETIELSENTITITPDVGKMITLSKNDFLFAQSEGNYTTIHYLQNNTSRKQLIRISLKRLEKQICSKSIIRCHRSYVFNTQKAVGKKGNAQGYKLNIHQVSVTIPVSRKYIDVVLKLLN
jgi:hypothetical protein